jgi:hypothetical protein
MSWVITGSEKTKVDPQFGSVSLLLHGNGTNGSTTIVDSGPAARTVTVVGDAQISTAQSKFGGASIAFDGTGDGLAVPYDISFATFPQSGNIGTIEGWFRFNAFTAPRPFLVGVWSAAGEQGWTIDATTGGDLFFANNGAGITASLSTKLTTAEWIHLAVVNTGSTIKIYRNGVDVGSASNYSPTLSSDSLRIGLRNGGLLPLNGYIDDLRITKGVARYTANFTPPTAPFPDI